MNRTFPLVSVIVPSYNHESFIGDCILSILEQTYSNIELIVLDDGSKDDSWNIISDLAKKNKFYCSQHSNMGLSKTLNKGLELANGSYVITIASDDCMLLDRVEKQVNYMEQHSSVGVCGGNFLYINEENEILEKKKVIEAIELDFDDIFWRNKGGPPAPTAMIRKSVVDEVGGYDPDIAVEDLYMWLKITRKGYKIAILEDVLSYYRAHGENSHDNYEWLIDNVLKIYAEYRTHPKHDYVVNQFLASMFVKVSNRDKRLALRILSRVSFFSAPLKIIKGIVRVIFS